MSSLSVKAYGVVVQDFCPLAINITRFSNGFRLNTFLNKTNDDACAVLRWYYKLHVRVL